MIESQGAGLIAFVVFYGLDWVATVPPTVALTADTFGRARVGVVFGWIFASHQLGAGAAAFAAGLSETLLDTYVPAFVAAPCCRSLVGARARIAGAFAHGRPGCTGARTSAPERSR